MVDKYFYAAYNNDGVSKMEMDKSIRRPKQSRSIQTKQKILDAAYELFCNKGYYTTTTNEIAVVAGVSIGSLYSYFQDKDTILLEILNRYNDSFMEVHDNLNIDIEKYKENPKLWFRRFIEGMVEIHRESKEFNQELQLLCHAIPEVAAIMEKQKNKIRQITLGYLESFRDILRVEDLEVASMVADILIGSIVDQVVFYENQIDDDRIISAGVDAVYQYLMA